MGNANVLTVSVNNFETQCGLFAEGQLDSSWTVSTRARATCDEILQQLKSFLDVEGMAYPDQAIFCSVVPSLTAAWDEALHAICEGRVYEVGPGLKTGLPLNYKDPAQVGADRVACAVAAKQLFGEDAIIASFDAITAFSVVDAKGAFVGGAISAGIGASLNALSSSAAQLPLLGARLPKHAMGRSTAEAIQSGTVLGEALRADGFVEAFWKELGHETRLIATGRYGSLVAKMTSHQFLVVPDLALQGLYALWQLNAK